MKSKSVKKVSIVFLVLLCTVMLIPNYFVVRIDNDHRGTARYIYGDKRAVSEISREDMDIIADIFDGKKIDIFALPACGFDENVAVVIGNKTFSIACDACGEVYFRERKGYFSLDEKENEALRTLLEKYGFSWPCV